MTDTNAPAPGASARPTFLTVLCILSFIGLGLAIIFGLIGYAGAKVVTSGAAQELVQESGDAAAMEQMEQATAMLDELQVNPNSILLGVACSVLALVGVVMMWMLKKTGFYLYTLAVVAGFAIPYFMNGKFDFGFSAIFSIVFIVLYAMNLKAMR